MALFHFGKKKEETKFADCSCGTESKTEAGGSCCCSGSDPCCCSGADSCGCTKDDSIIKVLGAGCKNCHNLYEATKAAVKNMGLRIEVAYVTDMEKIMEYGVMSMPALVVNETVVSMGKVLKAADVELKTFYGPPSETNFAGGLLVGDQAACRAACEAFAETICEIADAPTTY